MPLARLPYYQVIDGTLHFKDNDAFLRVYKALARLSNSDRLKFAETAGFKSLLTYQDEFVKACEAADVRKDEVAYRRTLAEYADILSVEDDLIVKGRTINFKLENPLLASYQDRTGVVYIGKALFKDGIFDQTIVLDGDRAKLNAPASSTVMHFTNGPNTGNVDTGARRASTCQYIIDKLAFGCDEKRHSRLAVYAIYHRDPQPNGQSTVTLTPYVLAFPFKKNAFGSWVHYDTGNDLYYNWTFTTYTTQPNDPQINDQPYQQSSPYIRHAEDLIHNTNADKIDYAAPSVSYSNIVSAGSTNAPTIYYRFDFPTNNGWHIMVCDIRNDMICY